MKNFAVIFDMDGVLIDSSQIVFESFNKILEPHNFRINEEEYKQYLGITAQGLCNKWKKEYGLDFTAEFIADETTRLQMNVLKSKPMDPSALNFLKELKRGFIPIGLGTSSPRIRAEKILESLGIKNFFGAIVTGDEVIEHKPNPEIFLKVSEKLGIAPEKCIVIEDAINGVEAAKRGKMKAIAYLTGNHKEEEFKHSDFILRSFSELSLEKISKLFT